MTSVTYPTLAATDAHKLQNVSVPDAGLMGKVIHTDASNPNVAPDTIVVQCVLHPSYFKTQSEVHLPHGTIVLVGRNEAQEGAPLFHNGEALHHIVPGAFPTRGAAQPPVLQFNPDIETFSWFLTVTVGVTVLHKKRPCPVVVAIQNVCAISTCHSINPDNSALLDSIDKATMASLKTKTAIGDSIYLAFHEAKPVLLTPDNMGHFTDYDEILLRKLVVVEPHNPSTGCIRCDLQACISVYFLHGQFHLA